MEIYIHIDIGDYKNLLGPYYCVGVIYNPKWKKKILELLINRITNRYKYRELGFNNLCRLVSKLNALVSKINNIKKEKAIYIHVLPISSTYIERYGALGIKNIIRKMNFILKTKYISNVEDTSWSTFISSPSSNLVTRGDNCYFIGNDLEETPEILVPFLYAVLFKARDISYYNHLFPNLHIKSSYGEDTDSHIEALIQMDVLPDFYLESQLFNSVVRYIDRRGGISNIPKWLEKYLGD